MRWVLVLFVVILMSVSYASTWYGHVFFNGKLMKNWTFYADIKTSSGYYQVDLITNNKGMYNLTTNCSDGDRVHFYWDGIVAENPTEICKQGKVVQLDIAFNTCGDLKCNYGETYKTCPSDCEKTSGFNWYYIIGVLVVIFIIMLIFLRGGEKLV
ncbi:hypothetical protein DRN75_01430 [Nanoarchaeota archaeon]|nr:MAG: hypothetical protein DRN75_01430 [Nanoarchaeota archaeon]